MRLVILDDYDKTSEWAAKYVRNRMLDFKPGPDKYFVLGLTTGATPKGMYKKLVEFYKEGVLSFKYVKTFNMDEYVNCPREHPQSMHSKMWDNLFKHVDILPENVHIFDGNTLDLDKECMECEEKIEAAGGIELFIGGVGPDGHIACNGPGSSLVSRSRVTKRTAHQDVIAAQARFFDGDLSKVPTLALTVGMGTVMDAREAMILVTGAHKSLALHHAVEQGVNHMWPVSAFQQHPQAIIICDEDATLELRVKTVKYFKGFMPIHNKLVADSEDFNEIHQQKNK
ncbi:glucosamine-6-phosphate deaminase 2-like [Amphiura filiformis]|uniref:glucosamine-6-phosphate deaminase 2-like n=1 Tax=Amphiura filiformis TaxID=82378 RepID=UPI003B2132E3